MYNYMLHVDQFVAELRHNFIIVIPCLDFYREMKRKYFTQKECSR